MRLSIMNSKGRYPRLGTVAALTLAMASGLGCSVASTTLSSEATTSQDAPIGVALLPVGATKALGFVSKTGIVTITMKDETAEIYMSSVDSSLWVNGVEVIEPVTNIAAIASGTKANIKTINVVGSGSVVGDTVILNYTNGLFGLGTATTPGTTVTLVSNGSANVNSLIIKGTTGADSFAFGTPSSGGAPYISLTNSSKTPTRDIGSTFVTNYSVDLGAGNDTFTSAGNAVTGLFAFGTALNTPKVAVYGGAGNDTLVEGTIATPGETWSGGAGTDTVDYSARVQAAGATFIGPVYVTLDPTGTTTTSGAVLMGTCASSCVPAGTAVTTPIGSAVLVSGLPTVTEGDYILDTEVILGTTGPDFMKGGPGCTAVTLNGGLGNDTFLMGATDAVNGSGSETLVGGGGTDLVDYSARGASVPLTVVMDGKTASGDPTAVTIPSGATCTEADIIGTDVANINLGPGGGTYTGNALNNKFFAAVGGTGASVVNGLAGDDTLNEGSAIGGAETFNGGVGTDTVDYSARTNNLTVVMDGQTGSGEASEGDLIGLDVENLYGGAGTDALSGNDNDNDIEGNGGGDTICGLNGSDTLLGNAAIGGSPATLHGSDCGDTINDSSYNLCLNAGVGGAPATASDSQAGSWCALATY